MNLLQTSEIYIKIYLKLNLKLKKNLKIKKKSLVQDGSFPPQFSDMKNLVIFSKILVKLVKFTLKKIPKFSPKKSFVEKAVKFVPPKNHSYKSSSK